MGNSVLQLLYKNIKVKTQFLKDHLLNNGNKITLPQINQFVLYVTNIVHASVYSNQIFFNRVDLKIVMVKITGRKNKETINLKVLIYVRIFFLYSHA